MNRSDAPILDPCTENVDGMPSEGAARYCDRCRRQVHDLSAMSEEDARSLLRRRNVCITYLFDKYNGQILFSNERKTSRSEEARRFLAIAAVVPLVTLSACESAPSATALASAAIANAHPKIAAGPPPAVRHGSPRAEPTRADPVAKGEATPPTKPARTPPGQYVRTAGLFFPMPE